MVQVQSTSQLDVVGSEVFIVVPANCYAADCTSINFDSLNRLYLHMDFLEVYTWIAC